MKKGFTLIEILVVIAIIGLLSSILIVGLNSAKATARDAKRQGDLAQIERALLLYIDEYGEPPLTSAYGENNGSGWDSSYQGSFMQFLMGSAGTANPRNIKYISNIPLDPINSGRGSCTNFNVGRSHYFHYCYRYYQTAHPYFRLGTNLEKNNQVYWIQRDL